MNEIKHIHLGRQPFTISVEAHKQLHDYLEAIKQQVGINAGDVVDEVEMRMAELLGERGLTSDKVLLPADVQFLKEQLGEPHDFKEEADPSMKQASAKDEAPKRLFRDTERGMIAGVAAGLAEYIGIDATIVRLLFILLTFAGGSGIIVYLILWLIVPEVKTNSDRLQMRGKAVTIDSLKQVVDRADVPGAAHRATRTVGRVLEGMFKVFLGAIGVVLIIAGGLAALWAIVVATYFLLDGAKVAGEVIFPIGSREVTAFVAAIVALLIIFLVMILVGVAMVRRRWQLPAWGVAALVGVFFVSASVGGALAADIVPTVHDRVVALHRTKTLPLPAFTQASFNGKNTRFIFVPDNHSYVEYRYYGTTTNVLAISAKVENGLLTLDTGHVSDPTHCDLFCLYRGPDLEVVIHTPILDHVHVSGEEANFLTESQLNQPSLVLDVASNSLSELSYVNPSKVVLNANDSGPRHLELTLKDQATESDGLDVSNAGTISIASTDELDFTTASTCDTGNPYVFLLTSPQTVGINGQAVKSSAYNGYKDVGNPDNPTALNCLTVNQR